jgi:hypothetical protein
MKSLTYLKLNFVKYDTDCECGPYRSSDYVYLESDKLIVKDKSLSNLKILIIGGKLFLLRYICFIYFILYALRLWFLYTIKNMV